jgi:hypothetical protein
VKRSLVAAVTAVLVTTTCGGDGIEGDPKQALADAFRGLGAADGLTVTGTLESTAESLVALAESEGDDLSEDDAEKILASSVTVSGRNETDPSKAQSEITVNVAGIDDAVQFKVIGNTLYVRAAVRDLVDEFDQDTASVDRVVQQAEAGGLEFVRPAVEGEWLSITGLDTLQQQLGGQVTKPSSADLERVFDAFAAEIEQQATVTEGDEDGPGTHLIVEIGAREAVSSLIDLARELGQGIPANALPPTDSIPDRDIRIDTWVEDDFVRQIDLDFWQFAEFGGEDVPAGVERFALRLAVDEFDDDVEAPDDAVQVNPAQLLQLMFGGMSSGAEVIPASPAP